MVCAVACYSNSVGLVTVTIRKYHAQKVIANNTPPPVIDSGPKGPPLAHVVIDEPTLSKGVTTIGGVVKNISKQELTGLSVVLELRRRKGWRPRRKYCFQLRRLNFNLNKKVLTLSKFRLRITLRFAWQA